MNLYIHTINQTIDYIEDHITDKLTLFELSKVFNLSEYHFNRIFKIVVGQTLKQYVLERKLAHANKRLVQTNDSVIDVAYDCGFEYPEVFSRAYKKHFGVAPTDSRKKNLDIPWENKAIVIERDLFNYGGGIAVKGTLIESEAFKLIGISTPVNENNSGFNEQLREVGENFINQLNKLNFKECFYTVVNCHGDEKGTYTLFHGINRQSEIRTPFSTLRTIPEGCYAEFIYYGDMVEMKETFVNDLYRWLMVKELTLQNNGIGMFNIYEKDYFETKIVKIRIPIQK